MAVELMIYLHKMLPFLLSPLVLVMLLIAYGIFSKKKRYSIVGLLLLYAASTFVVADFLFAYLENSGIKKQAQQAKSADAIVVLSGMMVHVNSTAGPVAEWADADRFFSGVDLYQAGKAPRLIFTGGLLPWDKNSQTEGQVLSALARRLGVPGESIRVTGEAQNTEQEARAVKTLMGQEQKILLVTSAFHMPRAAALFEREGFAVEAFPVDYKVRARTMTPMDFLPDPHALGLTNIFVREGIGRFYYWMKRLVSNSSA